MARPRDLSAPFSPQTKLVSLGKKVDIKEYPTDLRQPTANDKHIQFTLGDLHGQWLLFLWEEIKLGSIKLGDSEAQAKINYYVFENLFVEMAAVFERIKVIESEFASSSDESESGDEQSEEKSVEETKTRYQEAVDELNDLYLRFKEHLKCIKVINKDLSFALGGDETADRNGCDVCMIDNLVVLIEGGFQLNKIYASNHGFDFVVNAICRRFTLAEREDGYLFDTILVPESEFNESLHNLGRMIRCGIINGIELAKLVAKYYLPRLCIIDFIRDKDKSESKTFGTHAPNFHEEDAEGNVKLFFQKLCDFHGLTCDLNDPKDIKRCVDLINTRFRQWIMTHTFEQISEELSDPEHPYRLAMCNREEVAIKGPQGIFHIFGHCSKIKRFPKAEHEGYDSVDHQTAKEGLNPGELDVAQSTFSATPVKEPTTDTPATAEASKRKRRKASIGLFACTPTKTVTKKVEIENTSARPGHAAANQ